MQTPNFNGLAIRFNMFLYIRMPVKGLFFVEQRKMRWFTPGKAFIIIGNSIGQ